MKILSCLERISHMNLTTLRTKIDACDTELVTLLAKRFAYTQQIGKIKAQKGLPPKDKAREQAVLEHVRALAVQKKLSPDLIQSMFAFLMRTVRLEHKKARNLFDKEKVLALPPQK